jgi:hypothetical protein
VDVAQEEHIRLPVVGRDLGAELLEDVELGEERGPVIQVVAVLAAPAEGPALCALQASQVDAPTLEDLQILLSEVLSNNRDDTHVGEERGCKREVGGGSADD